MTILQQARCTALVRSAQAITGDNATAISSLIGALIELSQQSSDQAEVLKVAEDAIRRAKELVQARKALREMEVAS